MLHTFHFSLAPISCQEQATSLATSSGILCPRRFLLYWLLVINKILILRNHPHPADLVSTSPLSCDVYCWVLSLVIALCNYLIHLFLCSVSPRQDVRVWWKLQPVTWFIAIYAVPQTTCHKYLTNIYWMNEWEASEMEPLCLPLSSAFLYHHTSIWKWYPRFPSPPHLALLLSLNQGLPLPQGRVKLLQHSYKERKITVSFELWVFKSF